MATTLTAPPELTSISQTLDTGTDKFGYFRDSSECADNPDMLRARLAEDGYLYIRGFFERDKILTGRASLTELLFKQGLLHPDYPPIDGIAHPDLHTTFRPELAQNNPAIHNVVFGTELINFYRSIFNHEVLHFDFIWLRAVGPGKGTAPHCDLVYMGRGTDKLLTCWIPYGDVPLEVGGLMILENSHQKSDLLANYLSHDVDAYCENRPAQVQKVKVEGGWSHVGWLSKNPVSLREKLGGRWLTSSEYRMGDLLTFGMNVVHGSLDNRSNQIRLSSDTRYQRADEPADERWIGANPPAHSLAGKRGRIC